MTAATALLPFPSTALAGVPGFSCTAPSPDTGYTCIGRIGAYPKDVALVVPPAYRPAARAEIILHLHGHNIEREELPYYLARDRFDLALAASGRNAIAVVPLSFDKCADFETDLAPKTKFRPFLEAVAAVLTTAGLADSAGIGTIALTSHSGAYRSVRAILRHGDLAANLRELYLLDSTYGGLDEFAAFAHVPGHRLWAAFTAHLRDNTLELVKKMRAMGDDPAVFDKPDVPVEELRRSRLGAVAADTDHDGVVKKYWAMFLRR